MADTDKALVTRALRGSREAFEALVERYAGRVHAVALARTGDRLAAEDAAQTAFLEAFLSLRTLKDRARFRPWLLGIVRNVANGQVRSASRVEPGLEGDRLVDTRSLPDESAERAELRAVVMSAVQGLGEIQREAVMLHYVQGLSYEEIADLLDVPRSTIVGRLQTARSQLRGDLEGIVEEVLRGERSEDDALKARVMAAMPLTLFRQGSLLSFSWFGGKQLATAAASIAAAIGTSLYFTAFSGWLGRPSAAAVDANTMVSVEMVDSEPTKKGDAVGSSEQTAVKVQDGSGQKKRAQPGRRPKVGVEGEPEDSTIVVTYTLAESSHVEMYIADRIGNFVAAPVYGNRPPGAHTVSVSKTGWPASSYSVVVELDRSFQARRITGFQHHKPGEERVWSKALTQKMNQAMMSTRMDPDRSIELWEELLSDPKFLDRGAAFAYSIAALMAVNDSARVHAHIDSAVSHIPGFSVYNHIALNTAGFTSDPRKMPTLYPATAERFARKALSTIEAVPEQSRAISELQARLCLARAQRLSGKHDAALATAAETLELHDQLPERIAGNGWDAAVREEMAEIYLARERYDLALTAFRKSLPAKPWDVTIWEKAQRAYAHSNPSLGGWDDWRSDVESVIPEKFRAKLNTSNVGKVFPEFRLESIDGNVIRHADLDGRVTIVNIWSYWCGPCVEDMRMLQKLADSIAHPDLRLVGVHRALQQFGQQEDHDRSIRKVVERAGARYPIVADDREDGILTQLNVRQVPTTLVVDREGKIRLEISSIRPKDQEGKIREAVEGLLQDLP